MDRTPTGTVVLNHPRPESIYRISVDIGNGKYRFLLLSACLRAKGTCGEVAEDSGSLMDTCVR